jgi:hypothetical protein
MGAGFASFRGSTEPRRRPRHRLLKTLLLVVVAAVVVNLAVTPWVFRIGGQFTPFAQWNGYGPVQGSNGGRYLLFAHLQGNLLVNSSSRSGCSQLSGCDHVQGSAQLCTEDGATYTFDLTGQVHAWLHTDGARTSVDISGGSQQKLPFAIVFAGTWHGRVLRVANTDDAFTQVFTARGRIRSTDSTVNNGRARATLRSGSPAGFAAACKTLAGGTRRAA